MRLTGDGSEYARTLQQAQQQTTETAQHIEGTLTNLRSAVSGGLAALGSLGVGALLNEAFSAWTESEEVLISLRATLRANGREVDALTERYQEYATRMERMTTISDEAILRNIRMAESFDLTSDAAERAVSDAMGLARSANSSAESMIRLTAAMAQGDTQRAMMFSRMVPQLRGVRNEQEFLDRYNRLVASGFDAISESANTGAGRLRALREAFGNLMEDFGGTVAELLKPIIEVKQAIVDWFKALSAGSKQAIVVIAAVIVATLALVAAWKLVAVVASIATGGILPVIGFIVAAGVAAAYWLSRLGPIQVVWVMIKNAAGIAWDWIKRKASEFWDYIRPVALQLWNIMKALWEGIKAAAAIAWDWIKSVTTTTVNYIKELWSRWFGGYRIDWNRARDIVIEALIIIEFAIRNFGRIAAFVFDSIRLKFHQWTSEIEHWFQTRLPRLGTALSEAMEGNLEAALDALRPDNTARVISQFERDLAASVERQRGGLNADYDEFSRRRRRELFSREDERDAEERGRREQEAVNRGKRVEVEKFEAVARDSAEAVFRIYAYMERVREGRRPTGGQQPERREVVARMAPEAQQRIDEHNRNVVTVLREIRDELRNEEPQVVIEGAGLA